MNTTGISTRRRNDYNTAVTWVLLLLLGCVGIPVTVCCPDTMLLMSEADRCLQPFTKAANDTLLGGFTPRTAARFCRLYRQSVKCVKRLTADCMPYERDIGKSILNALATGIGQLCENERTFERYLKYAPCYANQTASIQCMDKFNLNLQEVNSMEPHELRESTSKLCRAYETLIQCVNDLMTNNCGEDAAKLFDSLIQGQVPNEIVKVCQTEAESNSDHINVTYDYDTDSGLSRTMPALWTLIVSAAVSLFCSGHARLK